MGVIQNFSNLCNSHSDSIEDVFDEIEQGTQNVEFESIRPKKIKHRSSRPHAVGGVHNTSAKSGKKKKRYENSNYLLSLADAEEAGELSIHDFIPQSVSVFSKILMERENMEIWNEFINCTDNDAWFQNNANQANQHCQNGEVEIEDTSEDQRSNHPAFSAAECFRKIDSDLRAMLRKKRVPMGALIYLENELVTFFINRPQSIYQSHIPSSFERLLVHALSQYMNLVSISYDRNGVRWTSVRNHNSIFHLPSVLLSSYLEQRLHRSLHCR